MVKSSLVRPNVFEYLHSDDDDDSSLPQSPALDDDVRLGAVNDNTVVVPQVTTRAAQARAVPLRDLAAQYYHTLSPFAVCAVQVKTSSSKS